MSKSPKKDDEIGGAETPKTPAGAAATGGLLGVPAVGDHEESPTPSPEKPMDWRTAIYTNNHPAFERAIASRLQQIIDRHGLKNYTVLFLFDDDSISRYHSDRLYSAARQKVAKGRDILLIIDSPGGRIEPAYLISKTLKRIAANKFSVAVPRRAKSAATLISLGADEVHMGMISQLGPIDPQVSGLPALALGNALNHIADIAGKCPGASDMLTKYLVDQAPIRILGWYERVSESAAQYGERLLTGKTLPDGKTAADVAKHLVQHYKDHSFVIDIDEAREVLGKDLIKEQTKEYALADEIYNFLDPVQVVASIYKKKFWIVGDLEDGVALRNDTSAT